MNNYRYTGYDKAGAAIKGVIEAASPEDAKDKLWKKGLFISTVTQSKGDAVAEEAAESRTLRDRFSGLGSLNKLAEFSRQLAVLVSTGTPLVQALGAVERQTTDPTWKAVTRDLREQVEQGTGLAEAMASHPNSFDAVTRSLIAAGESAGNLPEMLKRLSDISRKRQKTAGTIVGAMVYPALLIVISVVVVTVMLLFVVPRFAGMFESLEAPLPATTKFLLDLGTFLRSWWFLLVPGLLAVVIGGAMFASSPGGKRLCETGVIHVPLIGRVARSLLLARIARMLGVLLASHVKLLDALQLTKQAAGNHHYRELLEEAEEYITSGESLSSVICKSPLVTPAFSETVRNGEETGRMGEALSSLAEFMDEDNETAVKSLTSLLEPCVLIVLGLVVGFVALSLFLPMFDLTASAGKAR